MTRPGDALARACAWGCAWGFVVGLPPAALAERMPQAAAAAAVVWLLTAAAVVSDEQARSAGGMRPRPAGLPGGAPALVAAGLAVAAVLGRGAVAAAVIGAVAYLVGRRVVPSAALRLGLPTAAAAIGTWSVVAAGSFPAHVGLTQRATADAGSIAVLLACAAVATVATFALDGDPSARAAAVRWGAAMALGLVLAGAGRPAGLWLVVAAVAGAWPLRVASPASTAPRSAHLIPGLLTAVAGIDRWLG